MACVLDAAVGDPRWFPHPVRWMGSLVNWYDRRVHRLLLSPAKQRIAGVLLAVALPAGAYAVGSAVDLAWQFDRSTMGRLSHSAVGLDHACGSRSH